MFTNSKLTKSIRLAVVCGAASTAMFVSNVTFAEEATEATTQQQAEQEVERISVTGSRIRRPGALSASPIFTMDSEEITMLQTPQVEDVLRTLPGTIPGDGGGVNNGTAGAATVDLRGLGTNRTLVLMNGRRMIPFNFNGVVDTATVPVSLIDRIDVVTGGASAVYGSDAIAGAVNFVMKNNFEGVELLYNHSETGDSDGQSDSISLTLGSSLDEGRGNVAMAMSWTDRKATMLGDRSLGQLGIGTASGGGYQSFLDGQGPVPPHAGCGGPDVTTFESGGGSTTAIPTRFALVGVGAVSGQFREDRTLGADCSRFNFNPYNFYQTPQVRYSSTTLAHYDINDEHTVYASASYTSTSVKQQIAPSGTFGATFNLPLANPFIGDQALGFIIDGANTAREAGLLNPEGLNNWNDVNANGIVDTADYLNVQLRRRTLELGPRSTDFQASQFQFVTGIRGVLYEDWEYDVSYQYGESNRILIDGGYSKLDNIQNALDTTDGVNCANGVSSCVPIDLFGGFGTITDAMKSYATAIALTKQTYDQEVISAVVDGPVDFIQIPTAGEPLSLSFGYEHRAETGALTPDECQKLAPASCKGGAGGNVLPIAGGFSVDEFFVEGVLPIFEGQYMAESLDVEFAFRAADYDSVGNNETWKLGFSWRPVEDFLVRVMQQSATRAPNVGEIASPVVTGLGNATIDPCSIANAANIDAALTTLCMSTGMTAGQVGTVQDIISGQVNQITGTDPDNLPSAEEADTFTAGFVYTNRDLLDLVVSVDYYDIDISNTIGNFTPDQTFTACYTGGNASECAKIHRIGGDLTIAGAGIDGFTTNLKYRRATGVEVGINFKVDLADMGELTFDTNLNHYTKNERQSDEALAVIDCLGKYGTNCSPTSKTRWTQRITWDWNDVTASVLWRHASAIDMETAQAAAAFEEFRSIDSYDYVDLFASYAFNSHLSFTAGVDNVLEKEPPVVGNEAGSTTFNSGNTFPSSYSALGRIFRAGVKVTF